MEKNVNGCQQDWSNEDAEVLKESGIYPNESMQKTVQICSSLLNYRIYSG